MSPPVIDHRVLVSRHKNSAIWKREYDGEQVCADSFAKKGDRYRTSVGTMNGFRTTNDHNATIRQTCHGIVPAWTCHSDSTRILVDGAFVNRLVWMEQADSLNAIRIAEVCGRWFPPILTKVPFPRNEPPAQKELDVMGRGVASPIFILYNAAQAG
ncbi:copper radical oxidase [Moniliophthora roreri]|nr:copper radical oxidase [Moniliophthora roreri]